mgnify:CR=1 FL=1
MAVLLVLMAGGMQAARPMGQARGAALPAEPVLAAVMDVAAVTLPSGVASANNKVRTPPVRLVVPISRLRT